MTLEEFVNKYDGQRNISFDGLEENKGQCVQLVAFYVQDVVNCPAFFADAAQWYLQFGGELPKHFDRIEYSSGGVPQRGDVIIWGPNLPNSDGAGHIGVVLDASPTTFVSFDTNWAGKYAHRVQHDYSYVIGWLHPKEEEMSSPTAEQVSSQFSSFDVAGPTDAQIEYYTTHDWGTLNGDILQFTYDRLKEVRNTTVISNEDAAKWRTLASLLGVKS